MKILKEDPRRSATVRGGTFHYGSGKLSAGLALDVASGKTHTQFSGPARKRVSACLESVREIVRRKKIVYGINTGFGPLCSVLISESHTGRLQRNILISHSVGLGEPVSTEIVRLMLILKAHSLAMGYSGVRPEVVDRILFFLQEKIHPVVPSQGSLGASGDLAPLAHLFLPLIGLGKVEFKGKKMDAEKLHEKLGITPLVLVAKEGLALINGTQFMAAFGVQVVEKFQNCLDTADIIAAMSLEALMGSAKPFHNKLHALRPFGGSVYVASRIRTLLKNSEILKSHLDCEKVQDPYSLRCIPQVHGASRDAFRHLNDCLKIELNSVTDNPVIFSSVETISGGNFHGQPLALPLDYSALAASELGNLSDRRIFLLLEGDSEVIPKLLLEDTGLNSGFMMPQYTSAALASENKSLCFPASADSIPTSLGQEDHVSMGSISGRKALQVVENLEKILGIELFCAAQAFDFRKPLKSNWILNRCHKFIRTRIPHAVEDRLFAEDMEKAVEMVRDKSLVQLVNKEGKKKNMNMKNENDKNYGIY